jgi:hypothetical protein
LLFFIYKILTFNIKKKELSGHCESHLVNDDLDTKCDFWKMCLVGYIARCSPGFKALQSLIVNSWYCEVSLTIHKSGDF